jgi:putative ABC transport system substrate-binding protein
MKRFVFNVIPLLLACIVASFSSAGIVRAQEILATIVIEDLPRYQKVHDAMSKVLQAGGFSEEKLKIFKQTPNADKMSLTNSLRRAEAAGATLILTYGSQATSIAKDTVKDTPLLFADVYDPVALGVVKTLATPGTNASGATSKTNMETLVDALIAIKQVKTVGVLYTKGEKGSEEQLAEIKEKGKAFGFKVVAENARNPKEAKELGNKLAGQTEALYLTESIAVAKQSKDILASAQAGKCIVFSQIPGLVEAGSLIGLEAELEEQGRLVAVHALQALQGQKVYILPVREAKKVSLKINNATASQLGLTIPPAVASTAKLM